MGLQMHGLLLSGRPCVQITSGTPFQENVKVIFPCERRSSHFHFEPITKISQLMPLAEFSVPANKIRLPANEAP